VKEKKIVEMIKQIKRLIFPILILLIVLSFYLLNKDISEYSQIIKEQQIKIEEHETRINSQKNVLLFQGARLRDLENRIGKLQIKEYAKYK
jgi:hypothetical protein